MASLLRGYNPQIAVDTGALHSAAASVRAAAKELGAASAAVNKARCHERWGVPSAYQVTSDVDTIKAASARVERFLDRLGSYLDSSANEFESAQNQIIAGLGEAELNTL
ncbi:MAG: hypothetical protein LBJ84_03510 [Oscillospiraceae bacterium]|jgi:uncharacterized protein YukE|nr:hypothetical protein [Oscillospiraceae bacterium]